MHILYIYIVVIDVNMMILDVHFYIAAGVRNLINLVTFLLCDVSVLCIGTNYTDLFNAQQSLITLLYPFELG